MKAKRINTQFNLYYRSEFYSWADIGMQIQQFISSDQNKESTVLMTPAQDVFTTLLYLLYGFIEKKTIFPVSDEFLDIDNFNLDKKVAEHSEMALAIASSGSFAQPKIALISRLNIIAHCQSFIKQIPIKHTSIWLNCLPLNHIAGVMIIYRCWFNNASIVLHDNFDTEKVWQDIHLYSITHLSLVPRMLFKLLEFSHDKKPPKSLKYAIIGGDKLSDVLYQRALAAGWPIRISYGMTETTSTLALGLTAEKLRLLDGFSAQVSRDGVLKIKGDMVVSAYANEKSSCFKEGWFITSDCVELDGSFVKVIGRNDNMIISGGENISPESIESLLIQSPYISDIAIGKYQHLDDNRAWGDSIGALIVGDVEQFKLWLDRDGVSKKGLRKKINNLYQPKLILKVTRIPRNHMGKINRKAVQILLEKK